MMTRVTVTLPEYLQEFMDAEIAARGGGPLTRAKFIELLVYGAYQEKHHDRIEKLLLQGINSGPATPMTNEDWAAIQREGLARLAKEKKNAAKDSKKLRRSKRPA